MAYSSSNPFGYEEDELGGGWGAPAPKKASSGDILKDAMKKEAVIKDIIAAQEDLRGKVFPVSLSTCSKWRPALVGRVQSVQAEVDKLASGNATLQMYIDNLTKQIAKR
ncbi:hypothetical protein FRC10_002229 [Ceratobasidium sp. 414]|nr:hypothetical protein FRC10_002229 [Ceratobasidium sp. 414]